MAETYRSKAVSEPPARAELTAEATRATAVVLVAVLGFVVLDQTGALVLALDGPRSIPTVLGGVLLVAAGCLAWLLSADDSPGSTVRAQWRIGAVVFAILGFEQVTSLHEWARQWEDVSFAVAFGPPLALMVLGWVAIAGRLADRPVSLALFAAGAALWLAAQLPEAFDRSSLDAAGAAVELAGCGLLAAALLLALPGERRPWTAAARPRDRVAPVAERVVRAADARTTTIALAVVIVIFAALGGLLFGLDLRHDPATEGSVARAEHPLQWFDPNQELTVNTYFSALILAGAIGLSLLLAHVRAAGASAAWLGLALVLAAMSAEELVDIHGKAQNVTGVVAQLTFAPVILAAVAVGAVILRRMWTFRPARELFVGGALVWAVALLVDVLFGRESAAGILEEALEMTGSAMFALALLLVAKATLNPEGPGRRSVPSAG